VVKKEYWNAQTKDLISCQGAFMVHYSFNRSI